MQTRWLKGNHFSDHGVTVEGHPDKKSSEDPVYWLVSYFKERFDMDLLTADRSSQQWKDIEGELLFNCSNSDTMSATFARLCQNAGYKGKFSWHSLRSGNNASD